MIPFNYKKPDFKNDCYTQKFGDFLKAWKWKDKSGQWQFCTACYKNGHNYIYKKFEYKEDEWKISNSYKNNFLYDISRITKTDVPVVLFDNEMSIMILNKTNQEDFIFTTWPGDLSDMEYTDFSILENKKLYYFYSSYQAREFMIKFFKDKNIEITLVPPIVDRPGWNIPDDFEKMKLDRETIRAWITTEKYHPEYRNDNFIDDEIKWPFKILGPFAGYFFFLQGENGQIFKIKQGSINNGNLLNLAPLDFWSNQFGYESKRGKVIPWLNVQDILIRACNKIKPFDINTVRGRGIWQDKDKLVIHTGKELIFSEDKIPVTEYCPNGHVYERISELKLYIKDKQASNFETATILDCIDKLSVNTKIEKVFLTGWCVLAPFCGALEWRPHLWVTGPAGSGKTAIIQMIVLKMLGDFGFYAEGSSTGAGIVQAMKNDSFPIIHDEVDKSNQGKENLKFEIEIARSSSSTKGAVYKGTADQIGKRYSFNSMFLLSSINVVLSKKSDRSRFSIVNLSKNENLDWKEFRKEIKNTFSDNMCEKIRSLFFYNWNTVKKTIENFRDAAGNYCGDQRQGDQYGTLLAGYCLLKNFKIYSFDEAFKICEIFLKNYIDGEDFMTDEIELLNKIFTSRIKYIGYDNKTEDTTLLNLLKRAGGELSEGAPDPRAKKELFKYGINFKIEDNQVCIAYNYEWLKNILKDTVWYDNYGEVLKRLSFANKKTEVCYFGGYYTGRAVVLKADCLLRLSDDKVFMEAGF